MLAIGLGLLSLFGLGRLGLQSTKETDHDQRCAIMADAIFETLREYNARFVDEARTNGVPGTWHTRWQTTMDDSTIPFPPVANMSASDSLPLAFNTLVPAYDEDALSLSDWNPRYMLFLRDKDGSRVADGINLKQITLAIYPDGDTYSSEYRVFHTTLTNPGGLP